MRRSLTFLAVLALVASVGAPAGAAPVPFAPVPSPATWGPASGAVRAVEARNGVLYFGGSFDTVRPPRGNERVTRRHVGAVRLSDGELTGLRADTNGTVYALASDGNRLFVGGAFTTVNGVSSPYLAAVDLATGAVQPFAARPDRTVRALRVSNGHLYLGGDFTRVSGERVRNLARASLGSGQVDPGFAPKPNRRVAAIALTADGSRVWAGGNFTRVGSDDRLHIVGVDAVSGAVVSPPFASHANVLALDVTPDGSRVVTGHAGRPNLARAWNAAGGNEVWRFRPQGNVQAVHILGGNAYLGFHDGYEGNQQRKLMAVDVGSGDVVGAFQPDINVYIGVWAITSTNGALVAGGGFTRVSGVLTRKMAIFPG